MMKKTLLLSTILAATSLSTANAGTLDTVKANGEFNCGVSNGMVGFSTPNEKNVWVGLDVDFCRAVSAAIFNDTDKIKFIPLSAKERFVALQTGEIDLLSRIATKTMGRDASLGINFIGTMYYDGQGFMVRKDLGIKNAKELDGAAVCTNTGTTTEMNATDFFKSNKINFKPVVFEKKDEVFSAYDSGRCDVVTTDVSGLESYRVKLKNPSDHIVLPNIISKEPLTPAVRHGDDQWFDLVAWTRNCMINAEELGVNSENIESMKTSSNPSIKRLLGLEGDFGKQIGLDSQWCANVITKIGNYGEVYNRNLGPNAAITINRGLNNLWNNGGIMYAAPIR